jgi:hypothetical protein
VKTWSQTFAFKCNVYRYNSVSMTQADVETYLSKGGANDSSSSLFDSPGPRDTAGTDSPTPMTPRWGWGYTSQIQLPRSLKPPSIIQPLHLCNAEN